MKIIEWLTNKQISYLELIGILIIIPVAHETGNDWWTLLILPLVFLNGFISELVNQKTESESHTYHFNSFEESQKFLMNNRTELFKQGATLNVNNQPTKNNF